MNNSLCYIHRSATLLHEDGRHKTYLYSYNKVTHVRNTIITGGKELIEKEQRSPFCLKAIVVTLLANGYYVQDSKNMNNGKYQYDLLTDETILN